MINYLLKVLNQTNITKKRRNRITGMVLFIGTSLLILFSGISIPQLKLAISYGSLSATNIKESLADNGIAEELVTYTRNQNLINNNNSKSASSITKDSVILDTSLMTQKKYEPIKSFKYYNNLDYGSMANQINNSIAGEYAKPIIVILICTSILIIVLSFLALINTMYINALEQKDQFAILSILGLSQKDLIGLILSESVGISLKYSLIGSVFGTVVGFLGNRLVGLNYLPNIKVVIGVIAFAFTIGVISGFVSGKIAVNNLSRE